MDKINSCSIAPKDLRWTKIDELMTILDELMTVYDQFELDNGHLRLANV